ncbi:hypothetical protein GH714_004270 [Hevea brasiliensis]|uniref:DUF4378 domain-containing protein n=1 Tax=Hevea brasiliensis TaxID=3981 RepID=A0A6A6M7E0_HEVBR|nr:hypothetical protein GH714_004270 [Hevea brasiliensis]
MTATDPKIPVKQLRELLQEQQEPFILELCLVERGYLRNSFNAGSSSSFPCCHGNSRKSLKSSFSFGLKRTKKGITYCPKVLRSAYNQVISFNERLRTKVSNHRDGDVDVTEKKDRNKQEAVEIDRFSSASSSTVFNSCCGSDAEETSTSQQKDHISFTTNTSQSFKLCKLIEQEDSAHEWRGYEPQRRDIGFQIGDAILEEISSEMIKDMIDFLSPITRCSQSL